MNKNIGELIEHLQDKLEQNFRQEMMVNYPLYPMAVIYVGENAAKARECVDQVLQQLLVLFYGQGSSRHKKTANL